MVCDAKGNRRAPRGFRFFAAFAAPAVVDSFTNDEERFDLRRLLLLCVLLLFKMCRFLDAKASSRWPRVNFRQHRRPRRTASTHQHFRVSRHQHQQHTS